MNLISMSETQTPSQDPGDFELRSESPTTPRARLLWGCAPRRGSTHGAGHSAQLVLSTAAHRRRRLRVQNLPSVALRSELTDSLSGLAPSLTTGVSSTWITSVSMLATVCGPPFQMGGCRFLLHVTRQWVGLTQTPETLSVLGD